ncbi:MAG: type II toxin-antitoxin system RelE/ParE family toxin [Tepidisphaerales bacterium]
MKLRIDPDAGQEATDAADWYDQKKPGLGGDFLDELAAAKQVIAEHPARWPRYPDAPLHRQIHRYRLDRFPYHIVYEIRNDEILVVAIAHVARKPGYWSRRLRDQ